MLFRPRRLRADTFNPSRRRLLAGSAALAGAGLLAACGGNDDEDLSVFRMPAETEPQSAVMLASPSMDYKEGWSIQAVQVEMIAALLPHVRIIYLVNSDAADDPADNEVLSMRQALIAAGVAAAQIDTRVDFRKVDHADVWVRDVGGLVLKNGLGQHRVIDFDFDGYGYIPFGSEATDEFYSYDNDESVRFAQAMGWPVLRSPLVTEGGNLHVNGRGTVIATEIATLGRNPQLSREAVEAELKRVLGVRHVIWVPRSLAADAHTVLQTPYMIAGEAVYNVGVNHIDEVLAWVDDRTLLLPEVSEAEAAAAEAAGDPTARINRDVLEGVAAILAAARDQDGRPFQVIRAPDPGPLIIDIGPDDGIWQSIADLDHHPVHRLQGAERFENGEDAKFMLAAGYMNYVVANGVVLIPRFAKPGRDPALVDKDEAFRKLIVACYPGREVVQIDVDALTVGGGGMHCITQQIPA